MGYCVAQWGLLLLLVILIAYGAWCCRFRGHDVMVVIFGGSFFSSIVIILKVIMEVC